MSVCYGNAPLSEGMKVWVKVKMKTTRAPGASAVDSSRALSGENMKAVWKCLKG